MSELGIPYEFSQLMHPLIDLWDKNEQDLDENGLISGSLFRILFRVPDGILFRENWENEQIIESLDEVWTDALKSLQVAIAFATSAGKDFRRRYYDKTDPLCEALVRLQARACRISSAIYALLKAGYPDDAYARWRTLYEIDIIGAFIEKFGEEAALSYLRSSSVQLFKFQKARLEHVTQFGQDYGKDSITQQEVDEAESAWNAVNSRQYGRAVETIKENNITLSSGRYKDPFIHDLAEVVGRGHGRVAFLLGNTQVHANPDALWYSFGLREDEELEDGDVFYGASQFGMLGPGTDSFLSLSGITESLLAIRPDDPSNKIARKLLPRLWYSLNETFHEAKRKQEEAVPV